VLVLPPTTTKENAMDEKAYTTGHKAGRWLRAKLFCKDVVHGSYAGLEDNPREVGLMVGIFTTAAVVKAAGTSAAVTGLAASGPIMATGAAALGTYMLGRGILLTTLDRVHSKDVAKAQEIGDRMDTMRENLEEMRKQLEEEHRKEDKEHEGRTAEDYVTVKEPLL
jgi:hypothetical protein